MSVIEISLVLISWSRQILLKLKNLPGEILFFLKFITGVKFLSLIKDSIIKILSLLFKKTLISLHLDLMVSKIGFFWLFIKIK